MKNKFISKNKLKWIITIFIAILLIAFLALVCISDYLLRYAILRSGDGGNRNVQTAVVSEEGDIFENKIQENKKILEQEAKDFIKEHKSTKLSIKSNDNLNLVAWYYPNNSDNWIILVHGYRSSHKSMEVYIKYYFDKGFNVLLPDLRACGESEGKYIGMGWLDKNDISLWIDKIITINPKSNIVLHGNSMGGASVLMLSGENLKENVKAIISDSAYTSVFDIFESELKLRFGLNSFPILNITNIIADIKAKYNFTRASAIRQVEKSSLPILFIHGKKDDFVPFEMLNRLYEAKKDNKDILISENAGHVESVYDLTNIYFDKIFDFINQNNKNK